MTREEIPGAPGVYARDRDGEMRLVHVYRMGDYGLADIFEMFGLGRVEAGGSETALVLTAAEARQLKMLTDAYGVDQDPDFCEMCYAMQRFIDEHGLDEARFIATF